MARQVDRKPLWNSGTEAACISLINHRPLTRTDWLHYSAWASYWACDYPGSVAAARQLCRFYPVFRPAYGILIAGLGQMRQPREASRVMSEAITRFGNGYPAWLMMKTPEFRTGDHQHLLDGFRMAGIPRK